jgi:hypothetical protein
MTEKPIIKVCLCLLKIFQYANFYFPSIEMREFLKTASNHAFSFFYDENSSCILNDVIFHGRGILHIYVSFTSRNLHTSTLIYLVFLQYIVIGALGLLVITSKD